MKKLIVIMGLVLMGCNAREHDEARYEIRQEYKLVNGTVIMETLVWTWKYRAWAGDCVYSNTINVHRDSIVYYKDVEMKRAESYRDEWFRLNRPNIKFKPVNK
jgi:hypothetical protein